MLEAISLKVIGTISTSMLADYSDDAAVEASVATQLLTVFCCFSKYL